MLKIVPDLICMAIAVMATAIALGKVRKILFEKVDNAREQSESE